MRLQRDVLAGDGGGGMTIGMRAAILSLASGRSEIETARTFAAMDLPEIARDFARQAARSLQWAVAFANGLHLDNYYPEPPRNSGEADAVHGPTALGTHHDIGTEPSPSGSD